MKSELKIGTIQMTGSENKFQNHQYIQENIIQLKSSNVDLIVLQELHDSIYFCQTENVNNFDLAETIPGESTSFYSELAAKYNVVIVASLFEKRAAGLYHNTAVVFEKDGSIAGQYRKMHIPDDPGYYEKFYFTPGDLGFEPIQTSIGKLGVLICWDQWYPEAARIMALKGAEILIYPTAIGFDNKDSKKEQVKQLESWVTIQRSHAIANGIPVVSVNRVGNEKSVNNDTEINFWGNSFICGPQGEIIYEASDQPETKVTSVSLLQSEKVRRWWAFLRDRRIDNYQELNKRYID